MILRQIICSKPCKSAAARQNRADEQQKSVVGVGNIYANESLFQAAIAPQRAAKSLSQAECAALTAAVKQILHRAIEQAAAPCAIL